MVLSYTMQRYKILTVASNQINAIMVLNIVFNLGYIMEYVYANLTASISEFKKSPSALLEKSSGEPIALLNHNKPTAYLVPAKLYEQILDYIDDKELSQIAELRLRDKQKAIKVNLDEL